MTLDGIDPRNPDSRPIVALCHLSLPAVGLHNLLARAELSTEIPVDVTFETSNFQITSCWNTPPIPYAQCTVTGRICVSELLDLSQIDRIFDVSHHGLQQIGHRDHPDDPAVCDDESEFLTLCLELVYGVAHVNVW